MNDEATVHYQGIVDQMSLGMRWVNDTFGVCVLCDVAALSLFCCKLWLAAVIIVFRCSLLCDTHPVDLLRLFAQRVDSCLQMGLLRLFAHAHGEARVC